MVPLTSMKLYMYNWRQTLTYREIRFPIYLSKERMRHSELIIMNAVSRERGRERERWIKRKKSESFGIVGKIE